MIRAMIVSWNLLMMTIPDFNSLYEASPLQSFNFQSLTHRRCLLLLFLFTALSSKTLGQTEGLPPIMIPQFGSIAKTGGNHFPRRTPGFNFRSLIDRA
jgi:hypothetical protein